MNDTPLNIPPVHAELNRLLHLAAKVDPLRAENRHLREIIARMPKPRTIYSRRVDAPIAACPFCGGTSTVYESGLRDGCLDGEPDAWTSAVTCCSCAAVGPWRKADTRADAEQRALAAWSSREGTEDTSSVEAMRTESREVVVMYANIARRLGWTNGGMIDAFTAMADALDTFHRHIGAEPGSAPLVKVLEWAAEDHLEAKHLRTVERELRDVLSIDDDADIVDAVRRVVERDDLRAHAQRTAIHEAMSESPIPQPPPDCDLAGWIRYALAAWRSEREEANRLADLCQGAHDTLTALGAMPEGTPAERIRAFYAAVHAAFSAQLHEANDARTRLADNADWVIRALAHANKLGAKDTWHQDAARVIREFSAVLSKLTEAENEIDDCCRILHVSGDRDLRAVVANLMRELEERRCASIRVGWTADSEKSAQGGLPATMDEKP